jgi:hypothetical protein
MRELLLAHRRPDETVLATWLAQQNFRHAPRQVQEHQVRGRLGEPPQGGRDGPQQRVLCGRLPPADVLNHLPGHEQQTAFLQGLRVGGSRAAIGDAEFAEHTARPKDSQRQLAAIGGTDHDLDPAGDDHDHGVAGVAGVEYDLTAPVGPQPRFGRNGLQVR